MKRRMALLGTASLVASLFLGNAIAQDKPPLAVGNTTVVASEYVVGPCRFRIANMYGGHFGVPYPNSSRPSGTYSLPLMGPMAFRTGGFGLFCREASKKQIGIALGAKYVSGQWLRYNPWGDGPELTPFDRQEHVRTIPLKGTNWTGTALTIDDTTGDEERRARRFSFCLTHHASALCGYTPVAWLADRKKRNDLERIKAILQSIQFVDTPAPAGESASASTATPSR